MSVIENPHLADESRGYGDITFEVGFVISALSYYLLLPFLKPRFEPVTIGT